MQEQAAKKRMMAGRCRKREGNKKEKRTGCFYNVCTKITGWGFRPSLSVIGSTVITLGETSWFNEPGLSPHWHHTRAFGDYISLSTKAPPGLLQGSRFCPWVWTSSILHFLGEGKYGDTIKMRSLAHGICWEKTRLAMKRKRDAHCVPGLGSNAVNYKHTHTQASPHSDLNNTNNKHV